MIDQKQSGTTSTIRQMNPETKATLATLEKNFTPKQVRIIVEIHVFKLHIFFALEAAREREYRGEAKVSKRGERESGLFT